VPVRASLPDAKGRIRFLNLSSDRRDVGTCDFPDCFVVQRLAYHIIGVEHGGRLEVNSTPGEGTTVSIFLPLSRDE